MKRFILHILTPLLWLLTVVLLNVSIYYLVKSVRLINDHIDWQDKRIEHLEERVGDLEREEYKNAFRSVLRQEEK